MTIDSPTEGLAAVDQCDREAAADYCSRLKLSSSWVRDLRAGREDSNFTIQAFARHRLAALNTRSTPPVDTAVEGEVERLRAALRQIIAEDEPCGTGGGTGGGLRMARIARIALNEGGSNVARG